MKKLITALSLVFAFLAVDFSEVHAQRGVVGVKVVPRAPAYRRPPMPARGFVWIGDSWRWQRGRYVFVPGFWTRPPARNARYVAGRWDRTRYGYVWIDGYWAGQHDRRDDRYGYNDRRDDHYRDRYDERDNRGRSNDRYRYDK